MKLSTIYLLMMKHFLELVQLRFYSSFLCSCRCFRWLYVYIGTVVSIHLSSFKSCVKIPFFPALSELIENIVILWGSIIIYERETTVYSNKALACGTCLSYEGVCFLVIVSYRCSSLLWGSVFLCDGVLYRCSSLLWGSVFLCDGGL